MAVSKTITSILSLFDKVKTPASKTPAIGIITGTAMRSGFSSRRVVANIIARKPEAGAPVGNLPDGQPSVDEAMLVIMIEEIKKELLTNCLVEIAIAPTGVSITSNGANSGGPVVSQGINLLPIKGTGIIR